MFFLFTGFTTTNNKTVTTIVFIIIMALVCMCVSVSIIFVQNHNINICRPVRSFVGSLILVQSRVCECNYESEKKVNVGKKICIRKKFFYDITT